MRGLLQSGSYFVLQKKLNAVLIHDRQYLLHLKPLVGHSILFELTDVSFCFSLYFDRTAIKVKGALSVPPSLTLRGKSIDFLRFMLEKNERQAFLQKKKIVFEGDLLFLEQLEHFFMSCNFDFSQLMRRCLQFFGYQKKKVRPFLSGQVAYQQNEAQSIVAPILYESFIDDLLSLQQRVDHLKLFLESEGDA